MTYSYTDTIAGINSALSRGEIDATTAENLKKQAAEQEYGAKAFNITEFEGLLNRLEGSKRRQERGKQVEQRRNIMQQGLASMMSNF